jgi:hypothetical protein
MNEATYAIADAGFDRLSTTLAALLSSLTTFRP